MRHAANMADPFFYHTLTFAMIYPSRYRRRRKQRRRRRRRRSFFPAGQTFVSQGPPSRWSRPNLPGPWGGRRGQIFTLFRKGLLLFGAGFRGCHLLHFAYGLWWWRRAGRESLTLLSTSSKDLHLLMQPTSVSLAGLLRIVRFELYQRFQVYR